MMIDSTGEVMFSTGKEYYANKGIIGIDANLTVYDGYDGIMDPGHTQIRFTSEERRELADYMIRLWEMYKDRRETK
jgi:NAD(P)H-nitrite reductase large subunit